LKTHIVKWARGGELTATVFCEVPVPPIAVPELAVSAAENTDLLDLHTASSVARG
jgi:hypothetical protein